MSLLSHVAKQLNRCAYLHSDLNEEDEKKAVHNSMGLMWITCSETVNNSMLVDDFDMVGDFNEFLAINFVSSFYPKNHIIFVAVAVSPIAFV